MKIKKNFKENHLIMKEEIHIPGIIIEEMNHVQDQDHIQEEKIHQNIDIRIIQIIKKKKNIVNIIITIIEDISIDIIEIIRVKEEVKIDIKMRKKNQ